MPQCCCRTDCAALRLSHGWACHRTTPGPSTCPTGEWAMATHSQAPRRLLTGYERGRLRTAEGVRRCGAAGEPFRSSLMGFLDGNSEVLESLVNEMYARGLSTRDVEDAFRDATGELLI